ncbi:MAG: hypothetical protein FGF51_02550 [Candidatus Brockarchaeota archaeon]|nr:hypothetical protein [Candidatus Brockarchaeota archaeon]
MYSPAQKLVPTIQTKCFPVGDELRRELLEIRDEAFEIVAKAGILAGLLSALITVPTAPSAQASLNDSVVVSCFRFNSFMVMSL